MQIFIDSANLDEIKEAISWGIVDGCTTNPKIVATENANFEKRMKDILRLVNGPVSIEVTTNDTEEMLKEAEEFSKWGDNVVVKFPMSINGLKATKIMSEKGIRINVTACMSLNQSVMAAKAGATYVSVFWARIGDMGYDPFTVVSDSSKLFKESGFKARIIVGSIRHLMHINQAMIAGADIVTIPYPFLRTMTMNPQTDKTIDEFLKFWDEYNKSKEKGKSV